MQIPRWLNVLFVLIAINLAAVTLTSVWHLALAQEPIPSLAQELGDGRDEASPGPEQNTPDDSTTTPSDVPDDLVPSSQPALGNPSTPSNNSDADEHSAEIVLPDELLQVPALDDHSLNQDPIFQEFKDMFGGAEPAKKVELSVGSHERYYEQLENRLAGVQEIVAAAQRVAREAQELESRGQHARAEDLMLTANKLREMAAELLVREF